MDTQPINPLINTGTATTQATKSAHHQELVFKSLLEAQAFFKSAGIKTANGATGNVPLAPANAPVDSPILAEPNKKAVADAYKKQEGKGFKASMLSDLQKYKDDQLLSNPGGDHYYLDQKKFIADPADQKSFWGRIKKDVSDAFSNVKNFFNDFLFGAKIHYRDQNGQIQEDRQKGFVGTFIDFFKDFGSALSFGAWRPDGEEAPQGFGERAKFFFLKMKEAIFGDLVQGVCGSVAHMGEDLVLTGWNLAEMIPDATVGNFEAGKKATTAVFDNGQVALSYLTDILPHSDAWIRVHSPKLSRNLKEIKPPIYYNAKMPEQNGDDVRWKYVKNTPFRKTIETIGSLFTDLLTLDIMGTIRLFSDDKK